MSDHRVQPTQDGPRMDQNETDDAAKAEGIIAQTAQDLPGQPDDIVKEALSQRFEQSNVAATDEELDGHTEEVGKRANGE
jgi:hypothetical protein